MPEVKTVKLPLRIRVIEIKYQLKADLQLIGTAFHRNPFVWRRSARSLFKTRRRMFAQLDEAMLRGDGDDDA